jgi:hypothetical protein
MFVCIFVIRSQDKYINNPFKTQNILINTKTVSLMCHINTFFFKKKIVESCRFFLRPEYTSAAVNGKNHQLQLSHELPSNHNLLLVLKYPNLINKNKSNPTALNNAK